MPFHLPKTFLILSLSCLFATAFPADPEQEDIFEFAPFVVESTRIPLNSLLLARAVDVVGQERIQRANTQMTLDESLWSVPGVFILNPDNYAQDTRIAIRGFGARADFGIRGIRLIIDGIPATTPDGQGEVDGMDLGSAQKIEVLRGPSGAYYGASSGGIILIETESGPENPFIASRITLGDYELLNWQFKAGGEQGPVNYLFSGGYASVDGFRAHSETENSKINGKIRYRLADGHQVQFIFNVIDFPLQNDPGGLTLEDALADPSQARARNVQFDSGESVAQERFGITYDMRIDEAKALEFSVFHTQRDFANRLPFVDGGQVSLDRQFYGARIAFNYKGERSRFSAGLDLDKQDDNRLNYDNLEGERGMRVLDQNELVRNVGIFVVHELELAERIHLSTALRYDDIDFDVVDALLANGDDSGGIQFSEYSPSVGIVYHVDAMASLYANFSRSFETPTTTEFDNPDGDGFNPDLTSQQATNFEVGSRGSMVSGNARIAYNLAVFQIDISDALVPYELPEFPGREFYRNAGESTRRGMEAQLQAELGAGFVLGLSYTWSDFVYDDFNSDSADYSGLSIPGIPRHFGSVQLSYESESGLFMDWQTRLVGSFYANDANSEKVSSYTVSNLRAGYRHVIGSWTAEPFLGVNNLFDESYFGNIRLNAFGGRHYEPAPGRNYYGGLRVRYLF